MSSRSSRTKVPQNIGNGKFELSKKLGQGCFGEVYKGVNTETKQEVAIKVEECTSGAPQLEHEAQMLSHMSVDGKTAIQGFAEFFYFGREGQFNCLVMEFLGRSLEDRVQQCRGQLSTKTTILVAEQVLRRIEYLHSRGIVHRDIKPENFMCGVRDKQHHLYLIDFGLSKNYWDGKHVLMKQKLSLTGTARYASINAHRGVEQSRRDDLEAIGHMFLYFLRGSLPWSGLDAKSKQEKYRKIKEKKEQTDIGELCENHPEAFKVYLEYCRNLGFKDRPDYAMLKKQFRDVRAEMAKKSNEPIEDWQFEWNDGKDLHAGNVSALDLKFNCPQPDDVEVKRSRALCCLCGGSARVAD